MRLPQSLIAICLSAVAAAAFADTPATEEVNLARIQKYTGAAVESFNMWSLYKWQGLGPDKLAVWAKINEAYLLTIEQPCIHLQEAKGIHVTSKMSHQVNRRLDSVNFGSQNCRIVEIRSIDLKSMYKDGDSSSSASK